MKFLFEDPEVYKKSLLHVEMIDFLIRPTPDKDALRGKELLIMLQGLTNSLEQSERDKKRIT